MRKKSTTALIVFAKEPKEGFVKTRLAKDLSKLDAMNLYKAFVKDIVSLAKSAPCDERFLFFYSGHPKFIPFLRTFEKNFHFVRQVGVDLGERMYNAFRYCQKRKVEKMVVIGTDCLDMTPNAIKTVFSKLNKHDCILGPTLDGGYYLIALKSSPRKLFSKIPWSTPHVLDATLKRAKQLKLDVHLLSIKQDIDDINALKRFAKRQKSVRIATHTKRALAPLVKKWKINKK